jgi:hypothetical protein
MPVTALQAAQQVAAEQEEGVRGRAMAMLQADMPQEALEGLMLGIFRNADTDGSGALSRKVHVLLRIQEPCRCVHRNFGTVVRMCHQQFAD